MTWYYTWNVGYIKIYLHSLTTKTRKNADLETLHLQLLVHELRAQIFVDLLRLVRLALALLQL